VRVATAATASRPARSPAAAAYGPALGLVSTSICAGRASGARGSASPNDARRITGGDNEHSYEIVVAELREGRFAIMQQHPGDRFL